MTHRRFQLNYPQGGIEVQLNLDFKGNNVTVEAIHIHSTFDADLPRNPTLEYVNNEWVLVAYYEKEGVGKVREPVINRYSKDIVEEILEIKDEVNVSFSGA